MCAMRTSAAVHGHDVLRISGTAFEYVGSGKYQLNIVELPEILSSNYVKW